MSGAETVTLSVTVFEATTLIKAAVSYRTRKRRQISKPNFKLDDRSVAYVESSIKRLDRMIVRLESALKELGDNGRS